MKDYKNKKAFTLVEVLAALVILGLVAAMVIPSAVRRSTETANRTKIKKAMATYEKVMSEYYLSGLRSAYSTDINSIGKNGELDGLTGNALRQEKNAIKARILSRYQREFQNYFKVHTKESDSIFMTSDKLWWDIGTKGDFSEIKVAFKREDLTDAMADSNEYKAFYFIAKQSDVAVTPDTNPTLGMALSDIKPSDLNGKTDAEIKDIRRMHKLYSYLNYKISTKYCANNRTPGHAATDPNCCKSEKGKCIETYTGLNWDWLEPHISYKYESYDNGKVVGGSLYNQDDHWTYTVECNDNSCSTGKMTVTYDDGSPKKCYTYYSQQQNINRAPTFVARHIVNHINDKEEQNYSQYFYTNSLQVTQVTCAD